jgi:hypothetical protein
VLIDKKVNESIQYDYCIDISNKPENRIKDVPALEHIITGCELELKSRAQK